MKTTDPRDLTWDEIRGFLAGPRERCWEWLIAHGPATTSAIAEGTSIPLLTVRPRVCELAQIGFVECVGRADREGVYQAVSVATRQSRHAEDLLESSAQMPLKLS